MMRKFIVPLIGTAMLVFAVFHAVRAQQSPSQLPPLVEPASSPFARTLAGTGLVEADTENIAAGSHHPGVVCEVLVKVGDQVQKERTPLFRIDDRQLRAELALRQANLDSARAQLARLREMPRPEEVPPAEARLREAEEDLADQTANYERFSRLDRGAVAGNELVRSRQAMAIARARVEKAKADLALLKAGAWKPDIEIAEAAVRQAEAQVKSARTDLERLEVRASIDGEVLQVNVRPGEFVGAPPGQALVVLGGSRKHVRVDIDENDIARFRPGLPARAKRRGDRAEATLTFVRVEPMVVPKKSLAGGTQERVDTRVLQVIYAVEGDAPLYVGQQVDVFLDLVRGP